jgi:formylglycine-generating enzyme required for sulfatase activity
MGRYANVADRTFKAKFPENVTKFAEIWGIPAQQVTAVTDDGHAVAAPVGSYRPNAFGLYDMIGNVWEWCMDWHHDSYVGAPTNGSAWESPAGEYHVVRGGSWLTDPGHCRAASRDRGRLPRGRVGDGFRIVASRID